MNGSPIDFGFVCIAAARYAIGRRTYAPGLVTSWLLLNRDEIPVESWRTLVRDVQTELDREERSPGSIGDFCDVQTWRDFLERAR